VNQGLASPAYQIGIFGSVAQLPNRLAAITGVAAIKVLVSRENAGSAKLEILIQAKGWISDNSLNQG